MGEKMEKGIIVIGISIIGISLFIYFIKNYKELLEIYNKNKDKKILKFISILLIVLFIILGIKLSYTEIKSLYNNMKWYKTSKENDLEFEKYDELINDENLFYKNAFAKNYEHQNYKEPYIPEGFKYVEGEWNSGYVIQDEQGNQYVWIPCTNKENIDNVEILKRTNFTQESFISKDMCSNENYESFINSALENGGFFVSRYEIGNENGSPVSKSNVEVWSNINKEQAVNIVKQIQIRNVKCELINGYAYDTILSWLINTNDIEFIKNDTKETIYTGKKSFNNIFDFTDNVMEITSELNYGTVIVRGFPVTENANLKEMNLNFEIGNLDRFSIRQEDNFFSDGTLLGIRTIIYK